MRKAILVLILILQSQLALGQSDSVSSKSAGFEGAHLDLTTLLVVHAVRLNVDVSVLRYGSAVLGLRPTVMTDSWTFGHSVRATDYAAGLLVLFAGRRERSHLDLAVGPAYFFSGSQTLPKWRLYASGDFRIPIYENYAGAIIHLSTESFGFGVSIGWTRD